MFKYQLLLFMTAAILAFEDRAHGQVWLAKVKLLETTVTEVKDIVGTVAEKRTDSYFFVLKDGNLLVDYSLGPCVPGSYGSWNVPEGVVTHLTFHPKKHRKLSFYKVDTKKMKRSSDSGQTIYIDEANGISYWVQFDRVLTVSIYPSVRNKDRKCDAGT